MLSLSKRYILTLKRCIRNFLRDRIYCIKNLKGYKTHLPNYFFIN